MAHVNLSIDDARRLAIRCLEANGCDEENAAAVGDTVVAAERDICASHGLFRLPGYVASLRSGKVNGRARPTARDLARAVVRVDGDGGFAPLAQAFGRTLLIERARASGIGALSLVNIYHFGAVWVEVEPLVREGLCVFAFTSYLPSVAPAGGIKPLFGTNPMAFGWPRNGKPPLIFDQASASLARGEIMIAARDGHEVRSGVGIDQEGNPTTDPKAILNGAILPFGGYKGSAIAMMIELLAGPLIGESLSFEAAERDNRDGGPPRGGELILALDPMSFGDAKGFSRHAELLFERMLQQPGVRLPSSRRYTNREKTNKEGIQVPTSLHEEILALASGPAANARQDMSPGRGHEENARDRGRFVGD
jgi:delta1-piperideine-2-carboxylate reductase